MELFIQQTINGLSSGSIYVLVAIGITLVFGVSRLINFAHGQFLLFGSYLAFVATSAGLSFWLSVPIAIVGVAVLGLGVDRVLRPTIDNPLNGFIISLGLVFVLEGAFSVIWGSQPEQIPSPVPGVLELGGVRVPADRILFFGVTIVAVVGLFLLMGRTNLGRSMKAVAENRDAAALQGVRTGTTITAAFIIGAALAGLGGAFVAILFPFNPFTGESYIATGLAVALIGGLGRIEGALIVGLVLGVTESLGSEYLLGPEWRTGYTYAAMVAVLVWRPQGLFGGKREF